MEGSRENFIGIISDTHGLVRKEALQALEGARHILHAGDVGKPQVLEALHGIAPVSAIRGNVDGDWAAALPERLEVEIFGCRAYLLHDLKTLELDPAGRYQAVITGHSHKPGCQRRDGVLYMNPGSAGPRRFKLPVAVGRLWLRDEGLEGEIVELGV